MSSAQKKKSVTLYIEGGFNWLDILVLAADCAEEKIWSYFLKVRDALLISVQSNEETMLLGNMGRLV
jgi:hypothetical protein